MSVYSPRLRELVEGLRRLPGVGAKTAQRMALHLLQRDRDGARQLADALQRAVDGVGHCPECGLLTEEERCGLCASPQRRRTLLCVVESSADVFALEQATDFQGLYFVLGGALSPLDGIGPEELGLDRLQQRLEAGEVEEIILATNPTIEGEATAHYVQSLAAERGVRTTRIAHGVPMGGALEQVDQGTLSHAFMGRRDYEG
ncbi:recombination mediator RecR [Halorhodospira halophila]|uniref:Recombination protein RecR n=1 Tax=Halorhodospira halophila (strain DSM 244 / SL1) TaxID=349124 RepID=RECR_HALHL|nr:recombination mediator RecR [Halorhodospira halophila]A1WTL2.1 RecName: Full=Recombination protein RecR [Halorhodospira halophila SL1]ABM61024.1 recombination protein RecR [Halorhodospira halophila SL1]MBK1729967.1 recombination protein RecR [Halorhodospira halophila]